MRDREAAEALRVIGAGYERLERVVEYFARDYLVPDRSGRYGLPVSVGACDCDELDRSCPHVIEAENRVFEIEQTLRDYRDGRL